jgi:hypothetical protein
MFPLGGVGEYLVRKEFKVSEKLVVHTGIGGGKNLQQVIPGCSVQGLKEACVCVVSAVKQYRQRIPLK